MPTTSTSGFSSNSDRNLAGFSPAQHSFNRADAAAIALLVGSLFALFWKVIFTPAMFFYRDVFNYSYPHARFIHEVCRQGTLPFWNPFLNYGEPVLANPNFLFFYPSTLFLILLPINFAYTMHYIAHFAIAGVGTYWLARRWGQSCAAAFFAAFVFVFSGPVLSLGNFYNHAACAAWIPWALLLTDRAVQSTSLRPWLLLSLVFSLQYLAAEPFTLFATFGLCVGLALCRSGTILHLLSESSRRILGRFLLAGCLMAGLCAVQLLPSLDLLQNSRRGRGLTFNQTAGWSFHPLSLLDVVLDFFGPPFTSPSTWGWLLNWGGDPYFLSVFLGFVPLFFALVGWAWGRDQRRGFVAGAALTLLLLSFGRLTPVFALAYLLVPPLELVRFPVKLLVPFVLLTALLAGWGLDSLRGFESSLSCRRARILRPLQCMLAGTVLVWTISWLAPTAITAPASWLLTRMNGMVTRSPSEELGSVQVAAATRFFLSALQLYLPGLAGFTLGGITWVLMLERGRVWARRALPAIALLGLVQLVLVNSRANPTVPKTFYTYRPPILAHFQDSISPHRFCYISSEPTSPFSPPRVHDFLNFDAIPEAAGLSPLALGDFRDRLLLARGSMLTGVEAGISGDVEGSLSPFVFDFWGFALLQIPDPERLDCLLGRSNVRYLILPSRQPSPSRREVAEIFNGSPQPSFLYENLCYAPRAYAAGRASFPTSTRETLTRLAQADFDVREEVMLSAKPAPRLSDEGSGTAGKVEMVDRGPNTVTLRGEFFRPGYAVLLDRFDPNWHATVDGREAPVLRANQLFRAVRVAEGNHEIRFYYHQRGLLPGLVLSLAALTLWLLLYTFHPAGRQPT